MTVIRSAIEQSLIVLNRTNDSMDAVTRRIGTGKKINAPEDDPVLWASAGKSRSIAEHLGAVNNSLESVAISIRGADLTMETIGKNIDQMIEYVKNFPPYPAGDTSEERAKFLQSFNGIRQMINELTLPPRDDLGQYIMADSGSLAEPVDTWSVVIDEEGRVRTIQKQEVHTGPTGLNIPELSEGDITTTGLPGGPLDETKLNDIIANLGTAKETLVGRRSGLASDAAGIARAKTFNDRVATFYTTFAEKVEQADTEEAAAQATSLELKRELAIEALNSITSMHSELAGLLR
jgi:flagellin-like hook-associated protein FlgL